MSTKTRIKNGYSTNKESTKRIKKNVRYRPKQEKRETTIQRKPVRPGKQRGKKKKTEKKNNQNEQK